MYESPEHAQNAIDEYNGALLDNKVLTVEHDLSHIVKVAKIQGLATVGGKKGKTLRVGGGRRGGQ